MGFSLGQLGVFAGGVGVGMKQYQEARLKDLEIDKAKREAEFEKGLVNFSADKYTTPESTRQIDANPAPTTPNDDNGNPSAAIPTETIQATRPSIVNEQRRLQDLASHYEKYGKLTEAMALRDKADNHSFEQFKKGAQNVDINMASGNYGQAAKEWDKTYNQMPDGHYSRTLFENGKFNQTFYDERTGKPVQTLSMTPEEAQQKLLQATDKKTYFDVMDKNRTHALKGREIDVMQNKVDMEGKHYGDWKTVMDEHNANALKIAKIQAAARVTGKELNPLQEEQLAAMQDYNKRVKRYGELLQDPGKNREELSRLSGEMALNHPDKAIVITKIRDAEGNEREVPTNRFDIIHRNARAGAGIVDLPAALAPKLQEAAKISKGDFNRFSRTDAFKTAVSLGAKPSEIADQFGVSHALTDTPKGKTAPGGSVAIPDRSRTPKVSAVEDGDLGSQLDAARSELASTRPPGLAQERAHPGVTAQYNDLRNKVQTLERQYATQMGQAIRTP